jgi:hypothetical protein
MRRTLLRSAAALALALLAACTQKNTADQQAQQQAALVGDAALGIDRLLLFPNPIGTDPLAQDGGTFETNTTAYAQAYYAAIDATNAKDTIDKWKAANGFTGVPSATEHLAVFRDVRDLGYGRRMTGRYNTSDGSVAFYVENYNVTPNGSASYASDLNVDAAIRRDTQWHVGTNAIEWSTTPCLNIANGYPYNYDPPDCNGTIKFAKYFNFSSKDGTRQLAVDLDGHGLKAMPGPCITCHGGRGDPLTPPDTSGNPRFPLVENSLSRKRGDVQARLHGMNVDSFSYSTTQPGFAKSDLQSFLLDFNQWIMCTYPWDSTGTTSQTLTGQNGWGSCTRTAAGPNEWQGIAAEMIQKWYGGPAMTATFSDTYVPPTWQSTTTITGTNFAPVDLYNNVVAPYCRTCHILRGTKNQNDFDFMTYGVPAAGVNPATGFLSFADRIKVMVFDRGNMPLAQIPHQDFWSSSAPQTLASFVDAMTAPGIATLNGAPLMPGRPIADPGPDRMVRTGANAVLTGENSLFATSYSWTGVSGPSNPLITNPTGMVAIFNASVAGTYVINLSVNGGASSKNVTVTVDDNFPDPLNIKFAQVKNVMQNVLHKGTTKCVDCHKDVSVPLPTTTPPIWYTNFDRDNDGAKNTTDEDWFLKAVAGRVNLTEIAASPLLRKPSGNHHNAGKVIDVTDTSTSPSGGLRNYSILYNWILAGMPQGGVAANAIVNGSVGAVTVKFGGSPLYSTNIAVDGSSSIGAIDFLWSASGQPGPNGDLPLFFSPASATTSLSVPNVGPYTVLLQVDDGVTSDVTQANLVVSEAPISANFSPSGNTFVTFTPSFGNIFLSSTSTYGGGGTPVTNAITCRWQVTAPAGVTGTTLDSSATLDVTKPCGTSARLNVPLAAAGQQYSVQLTASGLGSNSITQLVTVSNSAPAANLASTSAAQGLVFAQTSTASITTHSTTSGGTVGSATISVVSGTAALNGSSSTTPVGSLTYSWCLTSQPDQMNFPASVAVCPAQTSSGASATLNMTVRITGNYGVQLTVDNGSAQNSTTKTVTVSPRQGVTFGTVAGVLGASPCSTCHIYGSVSTLFNPASGSGFPPEWDNATTFDGETLYQRVMQRVVVTPPANISTSHVLVCPNAGCFSMPGSQAGFTTTSDTNYVRFLNWIQDGAPPGN